MFTIKTNQKLLRTSGDPAQELIDSQVMGLEALEEHLMETLVMGQGQTAEQQVAAQAEAVHLMEKEALMEQDQLVLQVMVLDQTVGIPALVLMVVPVQVMGLEALEEHLMAQGMAQLVADPQMAMVAVMAQGMAQLVAQVLVMETVLTVEIPALVLLMAPEA